VGGWGGGRLFPPRAPFAQRPPSHNFRAHPPTPPPGGPSFPAGAKDKLRQADPALLLENMGVEGGHVSPLGLLNDKMGVVRVLLDEGLRTSPGPLLFHPWTNDASLELTYDGLLTLIKNTGHAEPATMEFELAQ
jgi:hypothetical protein